jgi:hypothetical protein
MLNAISFLVILAQTTIIAILLFRVIPQEKYRADNNGFIRGNRAGREARWNELYAEREAAARRAQREAQTASNETRSVRRARISDAVISPKRIWR